MALGIATKGLPIDTAYEVWTGIGAVGTVILGIARCLPQTIAAISRNVIRKVNTPTAE